MEQLLGRFAVVTPGTLRRVLAELNIKPYAFLQDPTELSLWRQTASEKDQQTADRFAPKPVACRMRLPNEVEDVYFWTRQRSHMTVFVVAQGHVILTAEYKPGVDEKRITLVPVSGVPSKKDSPRGNESEQERMNNCVMREFSEETGLVLEGIEFLGTVQKINSECWRYRGVLRQPLEEVAINRGRTEHMALLAMPLRDWLWVCRQGNTEHYCIEGAAADSTTFVAVERMRELDMIK